MSRKVSGRAPQKPPMSPPHVCTHNRMISDCVKEERHEVGKVRCVECGSVIPDPHTQHTKES